MNNSLVKLSLISILMLAANNVMALPNDSNSDNEQEAQTLEEAMLIESIDPNTGLMIYVDCPAVPECDDDNPPMAELEHNRQ